MVYIGEVGKLEQAVNVEHSSVAQLNRKKNHKRKINLSD
jgi:hypothetical protein